MKLRKIGVENISSFVLREIPKEIKKWKKLNEPNIEIYLGTIRAGSELFIVQEANPNMMNLDTFVRAKRGKISESIKIQILISISQTMRDMLASGPEYAHGHLCPQNILVNFPYIFPLMFLD